MTATSIFTTFPTLEIEVAQRLDVPSRPDTREMSSVRFTSTNFPTLVGTKVDVSKVNSGKSKLPIATDRDTARSSTMNVYARYSHRTLDRILDASSRARAALVPASYLSLARITRASIRVDPRIFTRRPPRLENLFSSRNDFPQNCHSAVRK